MIPLDWTQEEEDAAYLKRRARAALRDEEEARMRNIEETDGDSPSPSDEF